MDNTLQNTLTGTTTASPSPAPSVSNTLPSALTVPNLTGNNQADISSLTAAQQNPSQIMAFQRALQVGSSAAYADRQKSELSNLPFDPTKVSGGTFASIIGNMEQKRGADVSKIYASTLNAYGTAQEQITNRLQYLQNLELEKQQFQEQMKLENKKLKLLKKQNEADYKIKKLEIDQKQQQFEKEYALSTSKANSIISGNSIYSKYGTLSALYEKMQSLTGGNNASDSIVGGKSVAPSSDKVLNYFNQKSNG